MLNLRAVQAEQGDCLVLEYGTELCPRYVLIDGGPSRVYDDHLRAVLSQIRDAGHKLDLVVLSHVDDDHVNGLLDLAGDLRKQRRAGEQETIGIDEVWHNTFSQTAGSEVEERVRALTGRPATSRDLMGRAALTGRSIRQGDELTREAKALDIPINHRFAPGYLITIDAVPEPVLLGNLSLQVVGPTKGNLTELKDDWLKWLEKNEKPLLSRDPAEALRAAAAADSSVPNLSSIMLLAEAEGKRLLLTGDGRGDQVFEGLEKAGLVEPGGRLHVDLLKVPHHGSMRNATPEFFRTVTADQYLISANGKHDNPDLDTLRWIVEAAGAQGRPIQIYVTNATDATRQLVLEREPGEYGYELIEMAPGEHSMVLKMA
jgi:hypothetical protein